MIEISDEADSNIITTVATKEFTLRDWERLIPHLVRKSLHHEKVGWCLELRDFKEEEKELSLEECSLDQLDSDSIERIAIVSDPDLRGWAEELVSPLSSAEIRYFGSQEEAEAQNWLKA